jgi:hypothetical protein
MSIKLHGLGKSNKKTIKEIERELKKLEPVQIGTIIWATLYYVCNLRRLRCPKRQKRTEFS